jgi:hypothetical protein
MSQRWKKGSVKMETIGHFAMDLKRGDHVIAFDIKSRYHHFRLHPKMQIWFIFRCQNRFYQFVALPFGWGRSVWWFCRLMRPFLRRLSSIGHRELGWVEDFALAANSGPASLKEAAVASAQVEELLYGLGLERHPTKGVMGGGSTSVDHLGTLIDTEAMKHTLPERKISNMKSIVAALLEESSRNRRWVSKDRLATACGLTASFILAYPLARFHSRGMQCDISQKWCEIGMERSGFLGPEWQT